MKDRTKSIVLLFCLNLILFGLAVYITPYYGSFENHPNGDVIVKDDMVALDYGTNYDYLEVKRGGSWEKFTDTVGNYKKVENSGKYEFRLVNEYKGRYFIKNLGVVEVS